jgi:hypothetical protein
VHKENPTRDDTAILQATAWYAFGWKLIRPTKGERHELARSMEETVAQVVLAAGDFRRPMMVTPGTPLERIKILRDASAKTLNDPEVVAEAKKSRMDVDPTTGEELENLVKKIFDSPPEVLERVKKILGN